MQDERHPGFKSLSVGPSVTRALGSRGAGEAGVGHASSGPWVGGVSRIAAEHTNARAELGATERHHVLPKSLLDTDLRRFYQGGLPNVGCHDLTVSVVSMGEDVLDQVVAILIAGDCRYPLTDIKQECNRLTVNQRNARPVLTSLAHTLEVTFEEIRAANL